MNNFAVVFIFNDGWRKRPNMHRWCKSSCSNDNNDVNNWKLSGVQTTL